MSAGELSLDAAAVVAHHVPANYQASMTNLARHATVPQLRRVVSRHAFHDPGVEVEEPAAAQDAASPDDAFGSESERRACARPDLSMHYDRDGRFQLRYSAPATIGALVEQAVKEAKDSLFLQQQGGDQPATADSNAAEAPPAGGQSAGDPPAGVHDGTSHPSHADAIAEIAHRALAGVASTSRASHYRVYLHLDTGGAWINNRGAIPGRLLTRFLTDGVLQPVWETQGRPVSVGRTMRILPPRSRRLVEDRDRGCRFPGCSATRFVEIHHLEEWAQGGATDVDNQISLCPFHHDAVGRGDFTITGDPSRHDGLSVVNRYGHRVRPPSPEELAPSVVGSVANPAHPAHPDNRADPAHPDNRAVLQTYQPPTGERARWSEIEVPSDRELRDTFTARLHLVTAEHSGASSVAEPAVIERDPFDAIRRWDESG